MYEVSDIAFATFLVNKKHAIVDCHRTRKIVTWLFDIPEDQIRKLEIEWLTSESASFYGTYQILRNHIKEPYHAPRRTSIEHSVRPNKRRSDNK